MAVILCVCFFSTCGRSGLLIAARAPGDIVRPWEVEVSRELLGRASGNLRIEYHLDEYVNEARGKTWAPSHVTEGYLVLYREGNEWARH